MPSASVVTAGALRSRPSWVAALCGCVLGAAWQVTQARLWAFWAYPVLLLFGVLLLLAVWRFRAHSTAAWVRMAWLQLGPLLAAACLVAGLSGWRAHAYLAHTLPPSLEAVDIEVEGTIASMLQDTGNGQRWRFAVDKPQAQTQTPGVPALIALSWYEAFDREEEAAKPRVAPWAQGRALVPGQRWRMTVRLKRPHGSRNPHGFDYELQQWEQGVQATGYVREKPEPVLLELGSDYRLQRWRQWLRNRIRAQAELLPQTDASTRRKAIGVVAALAVGDQQAIELVTDK